MHEWVERSGKARAARAVPSQLRGHLEAEGPRLARRDVVVAVRRGPIALVEDVLDIELRLPGRVDLRISSSQCALNKKAAVSSSGGLAPSTPAGLGVFRATRSIF